MSTIVKTYKYGEGMILPTNVSKTGCEFEGWYDNSSLTGSAVTSIGPTERGDKYFYAKWKDTFITSVTHDLINYSDIVSSVIKSNFFRMLQYVTSSCLKHVIFYDDDLTSFKNTGTIFRNDSGLKITIDDPTKDSSHDYPMTNQTVNVGRGVLNLHMQI
jgi:uncharacterized repeat protein (TIGR02543 family)